MKLYDFFALYKPLLRWIVRNDIDVDDIIYMDVYRDYLEIKNADPEEEVSEWEIYIFLARDRNHSIVEIINIISLFDEEISI